MVLRRWTPVIVLGSLLVFFGVRCFRHMPLPTCQHFLSAYEAQLRLCFASTSHGTVMGKIAR